MKYRIKEEVGVDYDPWLNRWLSKPLYQVQERFLYLFWINNLSFFNPEEAESYRRAKEAQHIGKRINP
jgi:hypothetical protein